MKEKVNISLKELEDIALDSSIPVPSGFRETLRKEVDTLAFLAGEPLAARRRRVYIRLASAAASLALMVGIGLGINSYRNHPKDTFTDPQQAYAMLQESFSFISSEMDKCMASMTTETAAVLSKTNQIIDKYN